MNGFRVSNPSPLLMACARASLDIFQQVNTLVVVVVVAVVVDVLFLWMNHVVVVVVVVG